MNTITSAATGLSLHATAPGKLASFAAVGNRQLRAYKDCTGAFWFIAKDVCDALGMRDVTMSLTHLDADERSKFNLGLRGQGAVNAVSESGLYALIMRSRKPEAREFRKWITKTVLPALRRDGVYVMGEEALLSAATPEQLRTRLREIETVAAKGIDAKATRGLCALEERDARRLALGPASRWRQSRPLLGRDFGDFE